MRSLRSPHCLLLLLLLLLPFIRQISAQNLSSSQTKALFRLQRILEYPPSLLQLNNNSTTITNLCYLPPTPSLSLSCFGPRITELSVAGNRTSPLSLSFSIDSLFATLSKLPSLTSLSLVSLGIWGPLSPELLRLSSLKDLNLSSNHLYGRLPPQISSSMLRTLVLRNNSLNGTLPLISSASFALLQRLDLSLNHITGKIPPFFFSLPSVRYLNLSGNFLTGVLPGNLACAANLSYVDISSNHLVGRLPSCIGSNSSTRVVLNSGNCMNSTSLVYQRPLSYCSKDPLAAIFPPAAKAKGSRSRAGLILGIVGGIISGAVILGLLVFLVIKKARSKEVESVKLPKPVVAKTAVQASPRTPTDARHMSQAVRIGTLGLTPHRVFTMEELDEATNFFDSLNLISAGPQGQFYRGWLRDGSAVVVRCLKLKEKTSSQSLALYIDHVISKLRHVNLVSILGHCICIDQENSSSANNSIFLVFEHVSNGTLRSHLTEWRKREMLKWTQRIQAVIGVARGIQFLHTVTIPGIVGNDLRVENILLDEALTAKISNYNVIVSENPFVMAEDIDHGSSRNLEDGEKEDIYQLGLILLEVITGKSVGSPPELETLKIELQESLTEGPSKLREITDPAIRGTFALDSLQTLVTVALHCIAKDHRERPSIDDILWNLQYSVQVQDGWTSSGSLSIHSEKFV